MFNKSDKAKSSLEEIQESDEFDQVEDDILKIDSIQ